MQMLEVARKKSTVLHTLTFLDEAEILVPLLAHGVRAFSRAVKASLLQVMMARRCVLSVHVSSAVEF